MTKIEDSFPNENNITVTITLKGKHAENLLNACTRSKRSRRSEITTRIEDHLINNKNFIVN